MIMLLVLAVMAWRKPWVGLLGLIFVSVMHPQGYASGFMRDFPAYLSLLSVVVLATLWNGYQQRAQLALFFDWRLAVIALLWLQFVLTTVLGINPWAGWPRLLEVTKLLPLAMLVLVLIDSRMKLNWVLLTIAFSLAAVMLKGGYWALITGFHDRVYGPPGSQFEGNNEFAVAAAMAIPLLMIGYRQAENRVLRGAIMGLVGLGFMSALSSWSRGGLLSIGVVALLLVWHSRRKYLAIPLLVGCIGLVFVGLSDAWLARMQTLAAPELEDSAATRLALWRLGWAYALQHPWFGSGFGGWIYLTLPVGASRAWHSAYIEIVAEHGFTGLLLWLSLVLGSLVSLTVLITRNRIWKLAGLTYQAAMLRASLAAYMVGAAFLSIAFWELLYVLLACAIVLNRLAWLERAGKTSLASDS